MEKNKVTTYLLYAVGEIFLVVIGILIAVSINNWNNHRKDRIREQKILLEIRADLELMREEIIKIRGIQKNLIIKSGDFINDVLEQKTCDDSTAIKIVRYTYDVQLYPKTSGYKALESVGLDIIQNDTLRKAITNLFELKIPELVSRGSESKNDFSPSKGLKPLFEKHISFQEGAPISIPVDDEVAVEFRPPSILDCALLVNDPQFYQVFYGSMIIRRETMHLCGDVASEIDHILEMIN